MCFCILTMNQTESPLIPILIPAVSIVKCNEPVVFAPFNGCFFYPFHEHMVPSLAFLSFKKSHPSNKAGPKSPVIGLPITPHLFRGKISTPVAQPFMRRLLFLFE